MEHGLFLGGQCNTKQIAELGPARGSLRSVDELNPTTVIAATSPRDAVSSSDSFCLRQE